jgi:hypothetical protein
MGHTALAVTLRILSLGKLGAPNLASRADTSQDGDSIRGILSLPLLRDIMEKIRDANSLDDVLRPCERFDFIWLI